ncbi:peptidoglycan binding domain-containing protein [Penicillium brasilianum]|uniref:Peptidoglycan binding domain-containing protein n=1 Tax=Penicillium brasilianum TaxID=104259 RepID=A0A1S9RN88_PENBI|nr:peptidoglycan binding domain-containing protein [Penicillium brasilianum]
MAQLQMYNSYTWRFDCQHMPQGSIICIGPGLPPMPTARLNATCGPLVPGTTRPTNWSDLASLNSCPSNECCTGDGKCEAFGDYWCTPRDDTCMSNCRSTTTPAKAATKTTTTTKAETISTTTKTKAMATTTSQGPAWTLVAYTGAACNEDYYLLTGHKDQDSKCIDLPGDYQAGSDDQSGVYCKYFTDGGFSSSSCASAPVENFVSWSLTGGVCAAYDKPCGESGGQAISIDSETGCQADVMMKHVEMKWRSIRCMVH